MVAGDGRLACSNLRGDLTVYDTTTMRIIQAVHDLATVAHGAAGSYSPSTDRRFEFLPIFSAGIDHNADQAYSCPWTWKILWAMRSMWSSRGAGIGQDPRLLVQTAPRSLSKF